MSDISTWRVCKTKHQKKLNRRLDEEIKAKLDQLKADRIHTLEDRLVWSHEDKSKEIRSLEWVLGMRDEL